MKPWKHGISNSYLRTTQFIGFFTFHLCQPWTPDTLDAIKNTLRESIKINIRYRLWIRCVRLLRTRFEIRRSFSSENCAIEVSDLPSRVLEVLVLNALEILLPTCSMLLPNFHTCGCFLRTNLHAWVRRHKARLLYIVIQYRETNHTVPAANSLTPN